MTNCPTLTQYVIRALVFQLLASELSAHLNAVERASEQVLTDVVIDVVRLVAERVPCLREAGRPVETALLRVRLLGDVEVEVRGVGDNDLEEEDGNNRTDVKNRKIVL